MQRKWTVSSLALGIALGSTSNLPAQAPDFTTIDFPGGAGTQAWAINPRGEMAAGKIACPTENRRGVQRNPEVVVQRTASVDLAE